MLVDKTLVVWLVLADLEQSGGAALTVEDGRDQFDGIVYGERAPRRWMAGSDHFLRSQAPEEQAKNPEEVAGPDVEVMIAAVYSGNRIRLLRNGELYATYEIANPIAFGEDSFVLVGLRHTGAGRCDCLAAAFHDARIYDRALSDDEIRSLSPGTSPGTEPYAWWCFEDGRICDRMGRFPNVRVVGNVRWSDGWLHLDGASYVTAARPGGTPPVWHRESRTETGEGAATVRRYRGRLLSDRRRPLYHFVAPEGHCMPFDPNGALYWKGRYHLMYILQTEQGHAWGHVSSADLVHWRRHPLALAPGEGDAGIFSGSAALDRNGTPTITYWGLGQGVCIAQSMDPLLDRWVKFPENPVIRETQSGLAVIENAEGRRTVVGVADPSAIWVRDGRYYMLTGNLLVLREFGLKRGQEEYLGDTAFLFCSQDLRKWDYLGRFYQSRRDWTRANEDCMCPDFFRLPASPDGGDSERWMLLFISHNLGCQYYIGRYDGRHFDPEQHGRMTWSDAQFFAPESLRDERGRRIMWAWVRDGETPRDYRPVWSGTMSLPRLLWLDDGGVLHMRPAPELAALRLHPVVYRDVTIPANSERLLDIRGDSLEIEVEIEPPVQGRVGVRVLSSDDGREQTVVYCDPGAGEVGIDASRASLGASSAVRKVEAGPFALRPREPLRLRIFVDRSIVDVFACDRQAVVRRVYPLLPESTGVRLFAEGSPATFRRVRAWEMVAANPE